MSSSARPPRVIRAAATQPETEVFIVGASTPAVPVDAPLATAADLITAAEERAAAIIAAAEERAAAIIAAANEHVAAAAAQAARAVSEEARAAVEREAAELLALIRTAANEGLAIREQVVASAATVLTEAVVVAVRRIVGHAYTTDPALTVAACEEAVRAAAGQELLSIRVNPGIEAEVTIALADLGAYVRPDAAVEIGGCIVDLRNGTIDATLDARLSLAELAIRRAGGQTA